MRTEQYMPWPEQARIIKERIRQPIQVEGETFIPSVAAARELGIRALRLHVLSREDMTCNTVVTLSNGARFIRVPLHRGNLRPPIYWNVESLRGIFA
jgi:hypothetical protein